MNREKTLNEISENQEIHEKILGFMKGHILWICLCGFDSCRFPGWWLPQMQTGTTHSIIMLNTYLVFHIGFKIEILLGGLPAIVISLHTVFYLTWINLIDINLGEVVYSSHFNKIDWNSQEPCIYTEISLYY